MDKLKIIVGESKKYEVYLLSIMTILYFCKSSFTNFATAIGISTSITAGVILLAFVALFFIYFFTNLSKIKWDGILLILSCAVFFLVTIKIHPEYSDRFNDVYNEGRFSAIAVFSLSAGIYTYYLIRMFGNDTAKVYRTFKAVPYIIFFFNMPTLVRQHYVYAMDFGYQMEMAGILFLMRFLHEKKSKPLHLFFSLISMLMAIVYGARASVIGYVVFIALYLVWRNRITFGRLVLVILGIIAVAVYNSQILMMGIYNFFVSIGLKSRTLYLIASGDIMASDTARQEKIWPVLIELLNRSSFFKMYGAFGDRYYLNPYYPYTHNIILEILLTFGKCLGLIILISIAFKFFQTCRRDKSEGGFLTLAFGSFSLCRLMVSSSFWTEPYFWAFLALMVNCNVLYKELNGRKGYKYLIILLRKLRIRI